MAFPGGLNFGIGGLTIQGVTSLIQTLPAISELASSTTPGKQVTFIVIQVGYNDLTSTPRADDFVYRYHNLLIAANTKFPLARIFLMQMNPVNNGLNTKRVEINKLIDATYANNASFPYVKTCNIDRFWYPNGTFDQSVFQDGVHMFASGYIYYEAGLKYGLQTLFGIV